MQKVVQLLLFRRFIEPKTILSVVYFFIIYFLFPFQAKSQDFQNSKVNLDLRNATLKEALSEIQKQSGIRFIYDQDINQYVNLKITHKEKDMPVKKAIELVLKGTNLQYVPEDGHVMISEKPVNKKPSSNAGTGQGTGSLKGRIVEAGTSEPLPGATIRVLGTQLGTITDFDGYYLLEKVPEGKQTIEVSFIGYTKVRMEVRIRASETATYDVTLSVDNLQIEDIVVKGIRRERSSVPHASELLVTQEIKNLQVVASGISSEQISKSADRNAAQAVQRVSGVSIVDDKFVIVRGLNPRYNLTYLNDNVAPSTETNSRAFALDLIPSRVIDRIIVQKTASPENQADATGGVIKVYTKDAIVVKHFDVEFQLGVRPGTTFNSDFLTYNGGKWDWLGFDDGTRALPFSVPGYGSLLLADLTPSGYAKTFNPTLYYGKKKAFPNMQFTANYYNAFPLFGKTLSLLTSFSYKNDNAKNEVYKQEGSQYWSQGSTDKTSNEDKNTNTAQLNLLQNFTYTLNAGNKLFFKNFILQQGVDATVVSISHPTWQNVDLGQGGADMNKNITLSYKQRFLYAGNLGGDHAFGSDKHRLQWNVGYNYSKQETPDQRVIRLRGVKPEYAMGDPNLLWWAKGYTASESYVNYVPLTLGIISRLWSQNSEGVYNGSLDYTFKPLQWLTLKTGTFHQWKKRQLSRRVYTVHEGNVNPASDSYGILNYNYVDLNLVRFREQNLPSVWSETYLNDDYTGLYVLDRTSGSDMYVGTEQNNSGYIVLNLNPFKWFELHGGVRYEYNRQKIGAAVPANSGASITTGGVNRPILIDYANSLWLPSVNVSLKPSEAWVFRLAYGRTVNRTEFREVSPFEELDFENNTVLHGNPDLISADVENYDVRIEFYPNNNKGELISIGAFYKEIANPIERINTSNRVESNFSSISYRNATSATVKGVEAELRKLLDFIPGGLFRNLSVAANGSLIDSNAKFDNVSQADFIIAERPLQGQAPYLLNAGLYYDNAAWGTKVSVIYNYVGENIYAAGMGEQKSDFIIGPVYRGSLIELPRQALDFSCTQRIGKGVQVKFTVQNLLNEKTEMIEDFNFTNKYEPLVEIPATTAGGNPTAEGDNIASSYRPGRYFSLSVSYSF